jgi:hypothetical protein
VYLKTKILFIMLLLGLSSTGQAQSFFYSYIDPCTKDVKYITADMSSPIMIVYYGQVKSFTYDELQDGTFDLWLNTTYNKYKSTSPCQGAVATTTTTTSTNLASNVVNSVMNLNSIASISSVSSVNVNVGGTTSTGSGSVSSNDSKQENGDPQSSQNQKDGDANTGNTDASGGGGSTGSGNSSGSGSGKGSSEGSSEGQTKEPEPDQVEQQKTETQKETSNSTTKTTSRAKAEVAKPAILVTGDIVGIQKADDGSQDARGTMSYTRVKGDGTASLGFSADYMVNAKIGNMTVMRSWIGVNKKGHKYINVASVGASVLPKSWSTTALFVRVNSVKNFTGLYGAAGTYGNLYQEPMISTLLIGGVMYKGKVTKSIDGTFIAAAIWSPYTKYYTESFLESKPILVPFLNLSYRLTKTFGVGLTAGGTYVAGQDILNYQILMGAKLIL